MKPDCLICGSEMKLEKQFKNGRSKEGAYRIRRFKCTVCDYQTTIFADGVRDLKGEPDEAIEAVREHFKQQELQNRNIFM